MARRRRRVGVGLAVVLVVLVGLLLATDRVGASAAEEKVADEVAGEVERQGATSRRPEVTVGGFPFLTQVLDGRYQKVTIVLRDLTGRGVTVPELDIRANGVNADLNTLLSGEGQITADRVTGTATISYDSVRRLINRPDLEVSEENGRLRLRLPIAVAGQRAAVVGLAELAAVDGKIRFTVTEIRPEGVTLSSLGQRLLDGYKQQLSGEIENLPLPYRLRIDGVQTRPDGVAVTASAQSVSLSS